MQHCTSGDGNFAPRKILSRFVGSGSGLFFGTESPPVEHGHLGLAGQVVPAEVRVKQLDLFLGGDEWEK